MPESEQTPELNFDTLYKDLGQLRTDGLRPAIKKGSVPALVALAHKLAAEHDTTAADQITTGTANERHQAAAEQIRTTIETAAEHLDGDLNEAVAELFALAMPTPTPDLPTRRSAAAKKVRCAPSTFERYRERPLLEALATRLLDLYGGNGSTTESEHAEPPPHSGDSPAIARGPVANVISATKKHPVIAALAVSVVALAATVWALWPAAKASPMPPPGSIVNTWTGRASFHMPTGIAPEYGQAQIAGGAVFRACDMSAGLPCSNPSPSSDSITARRGDLIKFELQLHNPYVAPVPYVKLYMIWGHGKKLSELGVQMEITWPLLHNRGVGSANADLVDIHMPIDGEYNLAYVPGSTTLTAPAGNFLYHLPDGIMSSGIGLEDVGSPSSCFECAAAYTRNVHFEVRIG